MRYLRLLRVFALTELQFALQYRTNLLLVLAEEVITVATSLLAVLVLFSHTSAINGWTFATRSPVTARGLDDRFGAVIACRQVATCGALCYQDRFPSYIRRPGGFETISGSPRDLAFG